MDIILTDNIKRRKRSNDRFRYLIIAGAILTIIPIFLIVGNLAVKGYRQINFAFFTESAPDTLQAMIASSAGEVIPGGIANGLTGSLLMVLLASLVAIPLGLFTGIYLYESGNSRYAAFIRSLTEILQGMPSIILGIISYLWIVKNVTQGYSALAGSAALAIMMLPLIIRSTEETMKMIPVTIKEAAFALGTPYYKMIYKILIPVSFSGLATGVLLALSRIMGETAPLMFTALGSPSVSFDITKPVSAVPLLIWDFYNDPNMVNMVWSASLFLMVFVLSLNLLSRSISSKRKYI
ncbi:MAG TPA: phosphate ABC transporter permease PstA [Bacteroidales bacterium]|nr:phosphate ABC transporter permease PstA [Bacteroidales bacterium]HCI55612.1 phosphate ABC transporter permease PtsA [Bacteroidales bacterium]HQG35903.1 phosphate ABC transporter permease PstA [Bacteroidales bacterium]HQG52413.1 phosphate ABC transporter permease PstA [Bacteroidales bacterium]HQJ20088.1 phosphate ABC transporter permease PstA [Bacteroidales bacterium]